MKTKFLIALSMLSIVFLPATAQKRLPSLHNENCSIRQGIASGKLTTSEAIRLKAEESRLRAEAIRYKANDGKIGPLERADLRKDERQLDRNIFIQKHDRQRRH